MSHPALVQGIPLPDGCAVLYRLRERLGVRNTCFLKRNAYQVITRKKLLYNCYIHIIHGYRDCLIIGEAWRAVIPLSRI